MKLFSTVATLSVIFGCGIMSVVSELPERYIERDVQATEMVGMWKVTPDSEVNVNDFVKRFPDWGASAPWKTFTLNSDGSCNMELTTDWLGDSYSNDSASNSMASCSWNLAQDENLSGKISPVIKFDFKYPDNYDRLYSLYIFEEDGTLIIWDFIGDPDDFRPQDFVKVKE